MLIATASRLPSVTVTLTLPKSTCKVVSPAQWREIVTMVRRREADYAKYFGSGHGHVTRDGSCGLTAVAAGITNATLFATALSRRGQLLIYGMDNLPMLHQDDHFPYKTTVLCDAPKAPTPCVVIKDSEWDLGKFSIVNDSFGAPALTFGTKSAGKRRLAAYTSAHIGEHVAVVLDNTVLSDPTIQAAITGGVGVIDNLGSVDNVSRMAIEVRSGELPAAFIVTSIRR